MRNRHRYPENWNVIRYNIITLRARNHCENCGIENNIVVRRLANNTWRNLTEHEKREIDYQQCILGKKYYPTLKYLRLTKIVLTVAHLDHNEANNTETNLKAFCQKCHFAYDKTDNRIRKIGNRNINIRNQTID